MSWSQGAAGLIAAVVGAGLIGLGVRDARTRTVPVGPARILTGLAVGGLAVVGVAARRWGQLGEAGLGAALVTGVQLVAYRVQGRGERAGMGRADVRLGVPFGWTLGWFGLAFAVVGFLVALLSGLAVALGARRRAVPFVPFLGVGYWAALVWIVVRA